MRFICVSLVLTGKMQEWVNEEEAKMGEYSVLSAITCRRQGIDWVTL